MFNLKGLSYKKKLAVAACISSIISGTFTYVVLSMAAAAGRNQAALNSVPPDYVRYAAMGYSSETVTSKKNILFSITDDGSLCRTHLLCFDIDKHTLDILEIPCDTLISFDGYDGNFCEAYHTGVYKDIVSRVLLFDIDGVL